MEDEGGLKMAVAGIDLGSLTTKMVVLENGKIISYSIITSAEEAEVGARKAAEQALKDVGLSLEDLDYIISTGADRKSASFAHKQKTSLSCLARGSHWLFPSAATVFDIGGETCAIVRVNEKGGVDDSVGHDRCASGTGTFLQDMAKLMQMPLEDMAKLSLQAKGKAEVSSTCAVFAEQEVISHVHRDPPTPKNDVIAGIHAAMVMRIVGLAKRVGIEQDVVLAGGVAKNVGFVSILEEEIGMDLHIPDEPQLLAALGAAVIAQENV